MEKQPVSVKAVFDHALEIESAAERKAYLDEACADAPELRQQVEALLKAYEDAGSFLEKPAPDLGATVDSKPGDDADVDALATKSADPRLAREEPGRVIGPYKLLQQIGEGGMGTVWMAEQTHPVQRKVALKLIKAGMDSRQVIARFEAERQALALMDHPNIDRTAARIAKSHLRAELLAALDYWALSPSDEAERTKVLTIAQKADEDTWRRQCRSAYLKGDFAALLEMAERPDAMAQDSHTLMFLGSIIYLQAIEDSTDKGRYRKAVIKLHRLAQAAYPMNFQTNFRLGMVLEHLAPTSKTTQEEILGCYRTALALRPEQFPRQMVIGLELACGRPDVALISALAAIRLDDQSPSSYALLGDLLRRHGRSDEGIQAYRRALEMMDAGYKRSGSSKAISYARCQKEYGDLLKFKGLLGEADAAYRAALPVYQDVLRRWPPEKMNAMVKVLRQLPAEKTKAKESLAFYWYLHGSSPNVLPFHELTGLGIALAEAGMPAQAKMAFVEALCTMAPGEEYPITVERILGTPSIRDLAVDIFREAAADNRGHPILKVLLGYALEKKGDLDGAKAAYKEAFAAKPADGAAYEVMGQIREKQGQIDEAINAYSKAIEQGSQVYHRRALLYRKQGQWVKALADHNRAIGFERETGLVWVERGHTYAAQGQWDKAINDYSIAINVENHPQWWAARGRAHLAREQWDKAAVDLSEAIRTGGAYEFYLSRGEAYTGLGQWDKAIQDYKYVIAGIPDSYMQMNPAWGDLRAPARKNLAWLLATCPDVTHRDPARAPKLAKEAVELEPKLAAGWTALGVAHYRTGDWKSAVVPLMKWQDLKTNPSGADLFFLAMTQWKLDQKDEARKRYDQAVQWRDKFQPKNDELRRFQAEAEAVLGLTETPH